MKLMPLAILIPLLSTPLCGQAEEMLTELQLGDTDDVLRIESVTGQPGQLLAELPQPGITSPVWAIRGMLRHESVEGEAYLQLDNHFGDRGTYFTRSLAPAGPLGKLSGTSDWREFVLPFYANRGDQADTTPPLPEALTLSIYLPGNGTVYLRNVALYQYADDEDPLGTAGQWSATRTATLVGAIGGSLVGLWGGLIGFLVSRGKARTFAIVSANLLLAGGALCLAAGIATLATGQPYAAWYPLVLFGVILLVLMSMLRKILPRRYAEHELKKMQSMDA